MQNKTIIQLSRITLLLVILAVSLSGCDALRSTPRPNIVIILTDDLDFKLMPYLPKTQELLAAQGATFTNYFLTTPLCCPSRTSLITGEYSHNTDILDNLPAFKRFFHNGEETETLAVWLNRAGYKTSLVGKYLNLYPTDAGWNYVPPGWTDWHSPLYLLKGDISFYYNYKMNENGTVNTFGKAPEDYSTTVIQDRSLKFIDQQASGKSPFFILISTIAPHGPSTPAPQYADMYKDLTYPQGPSFGEADISDKPKIIQTFASSGDDYDTNDANVLFRKRAATLLSVDDLVEKVVDTLKQNGQLDNTYIFFMSDNGFHMGEHRFPSGKGTAYEEDIHVPFMVRGPGIKPNSQVTQMVAVTDVAPTIAQMADVKTADFVDGRSFLPLLQPKIDPTLKWRNNLLIEVGYIKNPASSNPQNISLPNLGDPLPVPEYPDSTLYEDVAQIEGGSSRGIRGPNFLYNEYENGETEFYDLTTDPYELNNSVSTIDPKFLAQLHAELAQLKYCTGEACRKLEDDLILKP